MNPVVIMLGAAVLIVLIVYVIQPLRRKKVNVDRLIDHWVREASVKITTAKTNGQKNPLKPGKAGQVQEKGK